MARKICGKRLFKYQLLFSMKINFHQIKWFFLGLFITGLIVSCGGPGVRFNIEKQNEFKAKFRIGMSKSDVSAIYWAFFAALD